MRSRVVSRLFTSANLTESATLVRPEAGNRNEYGQCIDDSEALQEMPVITAPLSGEVRLGLRGSAGGRNPSLPDNGKYRSP